MAAVNDAVRFVLELAVLASLGYWAARSQRGPLRWVVGIGAVALVAVVWAVFVTPQGVLATRDPVRLVLEVLIFGIGVAALAAAGRRSLAVVFGVLVVVHLVGTFLLHQR